MKEAELLQTMNRQLNREVSTDLRYVLQAAAIKGATFRPVRKMYLAEVADELGHAQYLATQIRLLGGTPSLQPDLTSPPEDVRAMLTADAEQERTDVANYVKLAAPAGAT